MIKGSEIIGKPVLNFRSGQILGKSQEVVLDSKRQQILAIVYKLGSIFTDSQVIPFEKIKSIGPDAVSINSEEAIIEAKERPEINKQLESNIAVKGLKVITETGKELGSAEDIVADETTGKVRGYIVTAGFVKDTYLGKPFLPSSEVINLGKDAIIVSSLSEQIVNNQDKGLKKEVENVIDKIKGE